MDEHCEIMITKNHGCPRAPIGECEICGISVCDTHTHYDADDTNDYLICVRCCQRCATYVRDAAMKSHNQK